MVIDGLAGSASSVLFSRLPRRKQPYLIVANDLDEAGYIYNDLVQLTDESQALIFPSGYKRDIKYGQVDAPNGILRTEVLNQWYASPVLRWVVSYPEALAERVASRQTIEQTTVELAVGQTVDQVETAQRLRELGFTQVDYVYEPGQFSVRGSILDVYSYSNELPYRVDFFGDEIDSIRTFNVETQLSEQRVKSIGILAGNGSQSASGTSLLDYIQPETMLICRDAQWLESRVRQIADEGMSTSAVIAQEGDQGAMDQVVDVDHFTAMLHSMRRIDFSYGESALKSDARLTLHCSPQGIYHKNFDLISKSFKDFLSRGYKILILSDNEKQIARLRAIFDDRKDDIRFEPCLRTLHEGFVDDDLKLCVFTDHQIFDRFHKYNLKSDRARSGKLALSLKELNQIEVGDYIVHEDHGIGKFGGLLRTAVNGKMQEMIKLTYLNGDTIFVSIHSLHKLSKYRGKEGTEPRLHKLGSGTWNKIKSRTKSRLKDIARDLIKLYAQRRKEQGHAFSPDGYLQQELEASFIYEDTPDQLKATQAVKADMESAKPMDRLVCGDVGFGKTEVAIRAAFKACCDDKQVAVLVPNTILAFQHYNTFRERLKGMPIRVDYLNRFRTTKEKNQIYKDVEEGKIDILIGTHAITNKNLKFKDLGLLIIDEEQKFGVSAKEKLKQLKANVDCLTLTATPIPRTLQFSLMGARDLSVIQTPPPNRQPIETELSDFNEELIRDAIMYEMDRGGQTFFISNRVENLPEMAGLVQRLVPDARVAMAHGRMEGKDTEETLMRFLEGDIDVLVATSIVENGLDIPNANTMIINNAQQFGLSDLHQMRGRVGRSNRKAFCYLLIPSYLTLTPDAQRRLKAIEEFSSIGSGFNIAMRDLDIRGAGNILGAEQSGFISEIGYDMYHKILNEAIEELKESDFADLFAAEAEENKEYVKECTIETDLEVLLPDDYVTSVSERLLLYKELNELTTEEELSTYREHLEDRFGPVPTCVDELIRTITLRRMAKEFGIEKIVLKQDRMVLHLVSNPQSPFYQSGNFSKVIMYAQAHPRTSRLKETPDRLTLSIESVQSITKAIDVLTELSGLK